MSDLRHRVAHALYALRGGECVVILPHGQYILTAPIMWEGYITVRDDPDKPIDLFLGPKEERTP